MKEQKKQPELRFKGFTDDWEQVKLKDVAIYIRGSFPQPYTNPDFYDELNGKPFVQVADIGFNLKLNPDTRAHISKLAENKSRFVEAGKVVVALQGSIEKSIGRTAITQYDAFFDRTILIFQSYKIPMNDRYFAQVIERLFEYEKEKAWGATISTITKEKLNDFIIGVTDLREQIEIGEFFQKLDQAITLQQRKLDLLTKLKQGYLQQLFPSKDKYLPRLRFKEFNGDWEQVELDDISNKVTEKNKDLRFSETLTNSAEYGIINQREFFDKDISNEKNLSSYYVVRNNDFIYNPRISNYAPVGPIKRNKLGRPGVMSPLYYVFRTHDISELFLEYYFETTKWHKFMKLNGDSGARSDRFAIKDAVFSTMPIPYSSFKEQQKIGRFFHTIEQAITLQQSKINQLNKLKQSYLQKLFP
ncbi:restriction endonuclease subunit S [Latilactobacillus curvatus]|uniref:restriction endonuclease subunit S n=1 Tax=Latilactobacillus curvatus TaxID=28038 RepID=UPI00345E6716